MWRPTLIPIAGSLAVLLISCSEAPDPTAPPSVPQATALAASHAAQHRQILMLDACDAATFNAVLGPGTCSPANPNRQGGMKFETFVSLLEQHQRVDAWRFAPDVIHVTRPTVFLLPNLGGIPHSLTEVEEFGGGFIPFLNFLSGNPIPAPECVHPSNPLAPHPDVDLIPGGQTGEITIQPGSEKKYMCCIHPWMRAISR